MKVSEMPYERCTVQMAKDAFEQFKELLKNASCAADVLSARQMMIDFNIKAGTLMSLAHTRFDLNSKDEFYSSEVDYYDLNEPYFQEISVEYSKLMLEAPFRQETEKVLGKRVFDSYEIALKTYKPCVAEEVAEENALVTEYARLMADMKFEYEGETMPLSVLRGKLENEDRNVRKKCAEAIGRGLEKNKKSLDEIYDKLVKLRDKIAKKLGYKNFIELGYYRMGRTDYNAHDVAKFRASVEKDLVPCVKKLKEELKADFGYDKFMFYDDVIYTKGKIPVPKLTEEELFDEAQKMYDDMSQTIGDFFRMMRENEAFDVRSREGKWGGGYCTAFAQYKQPFILANFNGTAGDVDVVTHEFGHALADKFMFDEGDYELDVGGMETAECHSMSMEFLSWPYMDKFFDDGNKYRLRHLMDAFCFIPYGTIVDEFQHIVYEHPEMTPDERDEVYLSLEKKYRPYMSFEGIPYLEKGTRWQYQMHIYEQPFYYIDYCLAQTVALGFLRLSRQDRKNALKKYIEFVRQGGRKDFATLVSTAGLQNPFEGNALSQIAPFVLNLSEELKKSIKE